MIEKMKFLSITGPRDDMDRVVDQYLSKYEIHLENALSELKTVTNLRPYIEANPYKQEYQKASELISQYSDSASSPSLSMTAQESADFIRGLDKNLKDLSDKKEKLLLEIDALQASHDRVASFSGLDYDVSNIMKFHYVKFRFGRISHEYYEKFADYIYDSLDTIMLKCKEDKEYVWIVYFVPKRLADKIDAIFLSMHFERIFLPDEYEGTPIEASTSLDSKILSLKSEVKTLDAEMERIVSENLDKLTAAHSRLDAFTKNFDIRKMAACTKKDDHTFYILCGWMTEEDAKNFQQEIVHDENTFCIIEDDHSNIMSTPPTKMKNPGLFKPFEMFIRMYGLPDYHEIDPTILIGITYSILFGFMFGDVGQGLCLCIGGFLLYHFKKINLAAIISCCGFFSTIFGFMFGSIFGFEGIIEPLWLHPAAHMTNLPFIGKLNTVFVVAVALGMGIILLTMILNMINSLRTKDMEKAWFDTNGAAGLVFYGSLTVIITLYMSGNTLPATAVLVVMFLIPLMIIFFKEPLTAILEKKSEKISGGIGMFVVQGFFELFEVLLSYFSNTLSFVRVGAFAVSHAAMMEVVLMLAGAESGDLNWAVVVLGNLFVCGMEGLIVGIQVLRLEYYELFSRFYKGTGHEFKPYGKIENQ